MRYIKSIILIVLAGLILAVATSYYLGFHYFHKYQVVRERARSIEESFTELEANLEKAIQFYKNPEFYKGKAQLYLEMALAENQFGTGEKRDDFCNLSRDSLIEVIKRNPVDAFAYFEMGKVYLLYNFPLLTYFDKGKLYFKKALEMKPADEFLNMNILYIFLTQWDSLEKEDQDFVQANLDRMQENHKNFTPRLISRWKDNFGNTEKLDKIFQFK